MRTQFRLHDGVRICHLDFSNLLNEEEALEAIDEAKHVIAAEPPKSVYTITDVTGSRVTPTIRKALQDLTDHNHLFVILGAVVGLGTLERVVLRGIVQLTGRRLVAVDSMAAAVDALSREMKRR